MTRFVVLSTQRSGSTWVVDMLTSHPRVVAYSELFMHGGQGTPQWGQEKDLPYWQTFIATSGGGRFARPYWLWRYLGQAFEERPGVDAIGFKLMYSQLTRIAKPLTPALWLKRVRIIHLMRRNALDVVLSKEAGEARRGVLHAREGQPVESVRVTARHRRSAGAADGARAADRGRAGALQARRHPVPEVIYEDLVANEKRVSRRCSSSSASSLRRSRHRSRRSIRPHTRS